MFSTVTRLAGILGLALASGSAFANISQWSAGVAASYSPAIYEDTPSNQVIIPVIGYEGEHIFYRGFEGGYRLRPIGSTQNIVFRVKYDHRNLKPENSDSAVIQEMDERKATMIGGVSYQLITMVGMFETSAYTDIGNTHNGLFAEARWSLPLRFRGGAITPSFGYAYNSERLNNHLYGVSKSEASRAQAIDPNFTSFDADWDGQMFGSISAYFHLTPNVRVIGGIRYTNVEGELEKSPLIGSGVVTSGNIGISYVF